MWKVVGLEDAGPSARLALQILLERNMGRARLLPAAAPEILELIAAPVLVSLPWPESRYPDVTETIWEGFVIVEVCIGEVGH